MSFKFEQLDVWKLTVEYIDSINALAERLPKSEDFNLKSQIIRAATSIALNVAEGSTGQSDAEQARFLGMAIRSLVETVACQHIMRRRKFITDIAALDEIYVKSNALAKQLQAFRNSLTSRHFTKEDSPSYIIEEI